MNNTILLVHGTIPYLLMNKKNYKEINQRRYFDCFINNYFIFYIYWKIKIFFVWLYNVKLYVA